MGKWDKFEVKEDETPKSTTSKWDKYAVEETMDEKKNPISNDLSSGTKNTTTTKSELGIPSTLKNDLPKNIDVSHIYDQSKNVNPDLQQVYNEQQIKEEQRNRKLAPTNKLKSEIDNHIVDVSRQWNDIEKAKKSNQQNIGNLEAQLADQNLPIDQHNLLVEQYKKAIEDDKSIDSAFEQTKTKATELQKAKSTVNKIYDVQEKLDMDTNDGALKATGNMLAHVYNAIPSTVSGLGALVKSVGDVAYPDNPLYNIVGEGIQNAGNDLKYETNPKYDDKHYITSTIGDIGGSILATALPAGLLGKAGKVAQIANGWATSTAQMADGIHNKAKEVGLSDKDAGLMTLAIAPVSGLLEVWGASNIIDNISGRKAINELVDYTVKNLAGKAVTKEVVYNTVGEGFKEIGKKYGISTLKSAGEEGATELAQGELESGAENIYDELKGKKAYGTKFFSKENQIEQLKNGVLGAVAGSFFGLVSGVGSKGSMYDQAQELKGPKKSQMFNDKLDTEVKAGNVTPEQAQKITTTLKAITELDNTIPSTITDKNKRIEAIDLISERNILQAENKALQEKKGQLDPAMNTAHDVDIAKNEKKINELNSDLALIANGKERVDMKGRKFEQEDIYKVNVPIETPEPNNKVTGEPDKVSPEIELSTTQKITKNVGEVPQSTSFVNVKQENIVPSSEYFNKPIDQSGVFDISKEEKNKLIENNKDKTTEQKINADEIIPTQQWMDKAHTEKREGNKKPILVKRGGKLFVLDGHHRIASDISEGKKTIDADVIDLDKKTTKGITDNGIPEVELSTETNEVSKVETPVVSLKEKVDAVEEKVGRKFTTEERADVSAMFQDKAKEHTVESIAEGMKEIEEPTQEQIDKEIENGNITEAEVEHFAENHKPEKVKQEKPQEEKVSKREKLAQEKAELDAEFAEYQRKKKDPNNPQRMGGGLSDEDVKFAIKYIAYYIKSGIIDAKELFNKLKKDLGFSDKEDADYEKLVDAHLKEKETESGIKHVDTAKERERLGMDEYEGGLSMTDEEAIAKAKKWIADGGNVKTIIAKLKNKVQLDLWESAVIGEYKNSLDKRAETNPTEEILKELKDLIELTDVSGTQWSETGRGRKLMNPLVDNLANFLFDSATAQGYPLTEEQIKTETNTYKELQELKKKYEDLVKKEAEQNAKMEAEIGYNKAKAKVNKASKKTHEEHVVERKQLIENFKKKLKDARTGASGINSTIPFIKEAKEAIELIKGLAQSYANEGVDKLDVAVNNIYADLKDEFDGLTKQEIINVLGGEYDKVKPSRNKVKNNILLIKKEAELLKKIRDEISGKPKIGAEKVKQEAHIADLQKQLNELRKENRKREKEMDETPIDNGLLMEEYERKLRERIAKLENDIKTGKYKDVPVKKEAPKLSREAKILKEQLIALEKTIRLKRHFDNEARSKTGGVRKFIKEASGIRRVLQTAIDWSVIFRQLVRVSLNPRYLSTTLRVIKNQGISTFNTKDFDLLMDTLHKDPDFYNKEADGIVYNDLNTGSEHEVNEDYPKSFIYKLPVIGSMIKGSNRGADAALNTARYELYEQKKAWLERRGIFRDTHPEQYKDMANWVMNMTGRGKLLDSLEKGKHASILRNSFYGARLMAAHINTLNPKSYGFDVTAFDRRTGRKFIDFNEAKRDAIYDMVGYVSGVAVTALAIVAAGGSISTDPDDPDFLQARFGDKVYDITGGQAAYVRTYLRWIEAILAFVTFKSGAEKYDKANFAFQSTTRFLRNKLSPNLASFINNIFGENAIGEEAHLSEFLEIYPMYVDDVYTALKEEGVGAIATVLLPNLVGVGQATYANKANKEPNVKNKDFDNEMYKISKDMQRIKDRLDNVRHTREYIKEKKELEEKVNTQFMKDLTIDQRMKLWKAKNELENLKERDKEVFKK